MPDIRTREKVRDIKLLDRVSVAEERMKRAFVRSKDTARNLTDENQSSPSEYAEDKAGSMAENIVHGTGRNASHAMKRVTGKSKVSDMTIKTSGARIKPARKAVKTAKRASWAAIRNAESDIVAGKAAETVFWTAKKAAAKAKQTAVPVYDTAVTVGKAVNSSVKAIINATMNLIAAVSAGGSAAAAIIILICLIAMTAGSCYGIFFSGEDTGVNMTMQQVIRDINEDYQNRIESIKSDIPHDDVEMSGSRVVWAQVLSVYAVKTTTDPDNATEVATMTDEKKQLLEDIFWTMYSISYRTETKTETKVIETDDGHGNILEKEIEVTHTTLYIAVSHEDAGTMASRYSFSTDQNRKLEELLKADNSLWLAVLYGIYGFDDMIVQIALSQIGNVGGEPYWSWYGCSSRIEWCACFVSWCADQCGYIENGIIPKYAGCVRGTNWFKQRGQWADNSIDPSPGMIIFFDWDHKGGSGSQDGRADHTGIVEKVENGYVYTVEGNTTDSCAERRYPVGYYEILGYGIPAY
ncbi:MAG: CHAP domain-containing protein [Eubacteriales bacterium]|nr:CHAP domain-containing protein [Eubacteriales bacterium]